MCMSIKFSVLMRLQGPGTSTFQQLARSGRNMLAPTFGQWQANGRLLLQTVLSISMAVVSALAMMDRTPGHRKSEVVHHGPGTEIPSMMITRSSCASFGKHKSPVSTLCSSSREARPIYMAAWEMGVGWIYWTWKAENVDEWSYQAGLNFGWIPRDPNQRLYPGICG